jgi:hypothetical protein
MVPLNLCSAIVATITLWDWMHREMSTKPTSPNQVKIDPY